MNILKTKEKGFKILSKRKYKYNRIKRYIKLKDFFRPFIKLHFLLITSLYPQERIGEWRALTSVLEVNDITRMDGTIYAATGGGLIKIKNNEYSIYTTIEGLEGVDISVISYDFKSQLWIGGKEPFGFLQIYDPLNNQSIRIFNYGLNSILDIQLYDKMSWVLYKEGQEVGLMKFIFDEYWQYRDSYRNFPTIAGNINCFTVDDSIVFVGMDRGLYSAKITDNMKDPSNWINCIQDFDYKINSMIIINEKLFFTTNEGLYDYNINDKILNEIEFTYDLYLANNLLESSDGFWFTDGSKIYLKTEYQDYLIENDYTVSSIVVDSTQLIGGSNNGILFINQNTNGEYFKTNLIPNTPVSSGFSAITVLNDGRLIAGSGHGISIYNGEGWRNILEIKINETLVINNDYNYDFFIADTVAYDFGEYIADMEQGPDGLLYCAIRGSRVYSSNPPRWSGGVIVIDIDDPSNITTIDTTFLSYHTTSGNSIPYQVTLDIEFDNEGNLWVANPYCINGNNPIHVRSKDGVWKHYGSSETSIRISQSPCAIEFDNWGRTWVSGFQAEEANLGIYPNGGISMLTFEGTPYHPIDYFWNIIEYNGTVWSLGMGLNNRLYYLTPTGLNYYDLDDGYNPVIRNNPYAFFPNISFGNNAGIKVDFNGNIWTYSPSQGVHILLENTSYWPDINGFRTYNSPLLSDEIRDIAFDQKRNLAYIATSKGINILRIPFGEPKLDYGNVIIFPSPFYIPSNNPMIVDGLKNESSMIISTLNGEVVRHIKSLGLENDGDQLTWDGRDSSGDYVSTGVYLILIYNSDGSHIENKITVIKQ